MTSFKIIDLGLKKYQEVLHLQEELFNKNIAHKLDSQSTENCLILCEHEPVFTLGKSGKRENLLVSGKEMNADFFEVNRGGDITFHGPGQLVAYPIFDLDLLGIGVSQYIYNLEQTIIDSLKEYGLQSKRIPGAAGVWLGNRKIAAIGAKVSRYITMHGLAVNVNTDLSYFNKILACGLEAKGTTSLQQELGEKISMEVYKKLFLQSFSRQFEMSVAPISAVF